MIRIMADIIQIHVVFLISGISQGNGCQLCFQILLQPPICVFCRIDVLVAVGICGKDNAISRAHANDQPRSNHSQSNDEYQDHQ